MSVRRSLGERSRMSEADLRMWLPQPDMKIAGRANVSVVEWLARVAARCYRGGN